MKQIAAILVILIIVLSGCTTYVPEDAKTEKVRLQSEIKSLKSEIKTLTAEKDSIVVDVKEAKGEAIYVLNLKVGVERMPLDFDNIIKDALNEFTFEIIVSKEWYDSLEVGDKLNEATRMGSLILKGSYGKQYVEVIEKRVE